MLLQWKSVKPHDTQCGRMAMSEVTSRDGRTKATEHKACSIWSSRNEPISNILFFQRILLGCYLQGTMVHFVMPAKADRARRTLIFLPHQKVTRIFTNFPPSVTVRMWGGHTILWMCIFKIIAVKDIETDPLWHPPLVSNMLISPFLQISEAVPQVSCHVCLYKVWSEMEWMLLFSALYRKAGSRTQGCVHIHLILWIWHRAISVLLQSENDHGESVSRIDSGHWGSHKDT